jgi:hypothetical protein
VPRLEAGLAVIVLLNVLFVVYLAVAARGSEERRPADL